MIKDLKICDGRITEKMTTKKDIIEWLKTDRTKILKDFEWKKVKHEETPENAVFNKEEYDYFKKKNGKIWAEHKLKKIGGNKWKWK